MATSTRLTCACEVPTDFVRELRFQLGRDAGITTEWMAVSSYPLQITIATESHLRCIQLLRFSGPNPPNSNVTTSRHVIANLLTKLRPLYQIAVWRAK